MARRRRHTSPGAEMQIALIRHPRPAIDAGVCYGRSDLVLHPAATGDLRRLAVELSAFPPGPIRCSPARRCRDTAAVIAAGRGITLDDRLLELDFGAWEGLPWDAVPRPALDQWAADPWNFAPPGGESVARLAARVTAFHAMLDAAGTDCVVVAHGGPLKFLHALLAGAKIDPLAPPQPLGSLRVVRT